MWNGVLFREARVDQRTTINFFKICERSMKDHLSRSQCFTGLELTNVIVDHWVVRKNKDAVFAQAEIELERGHSGLKSFLHSWKSVFGVGVATAAVTLDVESERGGRRDEADAENAYHNNSSVRLYEITRLLDGYLRRINHNRF